MRAQLIGIAVLTVVAGVVVVATDNSDTAIQAAAHAQFSPSMRVGVWNWTQPDFTDTAQDDKNAAVLKDQGVNEVYIDISAYNDYDELTTSNRRAKIDGFSHALMAEVAALHKQGISAQALVGNNHWSDPDAAYIPLKLINYVHSYNASASTDEQLGGIQFDIEFYNDKEFTDNQTQNTSNYLTLVKQLVALRSQLFGGDSHFALGFAVPDVLNGRDKSFVPDVAFNGLAAQPPLPSMVSMLKDIPNSYIALMTYRNHATGDDGTINLVASSLKTIEEVGAGKVSVLVSEETTKQSPAKISYYGSTKTVLHNDVGQIEQTYKDNPAFSGVAIEDQDGFLALKD